MKRAKREKVVIYISPNHFEMKSTKSGFDLHLFGNTNNGEGKRHEIVFHFELWWISHFIDEFRKLLEHKMTLIKDIRKLIIP